MTYRLSIFSQYGQFYIADKDAIGDTADSSFWNDQALSDRLAKADGILGISIQNDQAIANIEIELKDSKLDEADLSRFDHVVEGCILIKSGKLQILDCPNFQVELEIPVAPDWYKVRVCSENLKGAHQENPTDKYSIQIWKDIHSDTKVLKKWHCS